MNMVILPGRDGGLASPGFNSPAETAVSATPVFRSMVDVWMDISSSPSGSMVRCRTWLALRVSHARGYTIEKGRSAGRRGNSIREPITIHAGLERRRGRETAVVGVHGIPIRPVSQSDRSLWAGGAA